jgi:hypothetical protein
MVLTSFTTLSQAMLDEVRTVNSVLTFHIGILDLKPIIASVSVIII